MINDQMVKVYSPNLTVVLCNCACISKTDKVNKKFNQAYLKNW